MEEIAAEEQQVGLLRLALDQHFLEGGERVAAAHGVFLLLARRGAAHPWSAREARVQNWRGARARITM